MSTAIDDKVKTPFSRADRNQLMAWSKLAKEKGLLDGFQRKVLYEGGHYNYIFVSRLNRLVSTLENLSEQLEDDQQDKATELNNVGYRCYLQAKAKSGNAEIQYMFGDALYYGLFGLEEDETQASEWMIKSADQGNAEAQLCLNGWYYLGLCGLEEDEPKALELLTKAAKSGLADAEKRLGDWYKEGIVVI